MIGGQKMFGSIMKVSHKETRQTELSAAKPIKERFPPEKIKN
jgi:hypothetical protein